MNTMIDKTTLITLTAIVCVTLLEIVALLKGINGKLLATSFLVIGSLGGYHLKDTISKLLHPTNRPE